MWLAASGSVLSLPGLSDDMHCVTIASVDAAGNSESLPPPPLCFVVDTQPPVLQLTSTPPTWSNATAVQVCVAVIDATSVTLAGTIDGTLSMTVTPDGSCLVGSVASICLY